MKEFLNTQYIISRYYGCYKSTRNITYCSPIIVIIITIINSLSATILPVK